jgi:hypothetical protein
MDKKTTDSRSVEKVTNQLRKLVDTDKFQSEVFAIRAALGIPFKGHEMTQRDRDHLGDPFYMPENTEFDNGATKSSFQKQINILTKTLEDMLAIQSAFLKEVIKGYVYYNSLEFDEIAKRMPSSSKTALCEFRDWKLILMERFWNDEVDSDLAVGFAEELIRGAKVYPLTLGIHPDAGQEDIIAYIKANWERIKNAQTRYAVDPSKSIKNSKVKINEKNKKIKDFVYENRHLSLREISTKLSEELGIDRDIGAVGKIRSLEIKRRKK